MSYRTEILSDLQASNLTAQHGKGVAYQHHDLAALASRPKAFLFTARKTVNETRAPSCERLFSEPVRDFLRLVDVSLTKPLATARSQGVQYKEQEITTLVGRHWAVQERSRKWHVFVPLKSCICHSYKKFPAGVASTLYTFSSWMCSEVLA
jgi:hypothetical protein